MNYELAKKLKDAGFAGIGDEGMWVCEHGEKYSSREILKEKPDHIKSCLFYYCPTLEELIEACEVGFGSLFVQSRRNGNVVWEATPLLDTMLPDGTAGRVGSTPIEALVNLYVALNQK